MTRMSPIKTMLRPGLTAVGVTASGRKGATRWEVWEGEPDPVGLDGYLGDIVRFNPEGVWEWQPSEGDVISGRDPYAVAREAGLAPEPNWPKLP